MVWLLHPSSAFSQSHSPQQNGAISDALTLQLSILHHLTRPFSNPIQHPPCLHPPPPSSSTVFPWFSSPTLHPCNGTILNHPTLGLAIRASPAPGNILTASPPSSYPCVLQSPLLPLTLTLCHPTEPTSTVSLHPLPPNTCPSPTTHSAILHNINALKS